MRDTERGRDIGRGRSRLPARGPDVGLDPGTPRSQPEQKADAQPLSHPGAPRRVFFLLSATFPMYFLFLCTSCNVVIERQTTGNIL